MRRLAAVAAIGLWLAGAGATDVDMKTPEGGVWVDSKDKALSLRLTTPRATVKGEKGLELVAELRNNSKQTVTVLRPFGDAFIAMESGLQIEGPKGKVKYDGPMKSYALGTGAYVTIEPGKTAADSLSIEKKYFSGSTLPGKYVIKYRYVAGGEAPKGVGEFWKGEIVSGEVVVTRE